MAIRRGGNTTDYLWGTSSTDYLYGNGGDDYLYGLDGNDWLYGDAGNDWLFGDWGDDHLYGGGDNDRLYGGVGKDYLEGGGGDDLLDGGTGPDTMIGGLGNDTYYVDTVEYVGSDVRDETIEAADGGFFDTVYATVDHVLQANIEVLRLTGGAVIGVGNEEDNWIYGSALNNVLSGQDGHDRLYGGGGTDTFFGGDGNDWFYVDSDDDYAFESESWTGGHDTIVSTINWTLTDEEGLEGLLLVEGSAAVTGIGNDLDNDIFGNSRNNFLLGGDGNDMLDGAAGADRMWGGEGNDEYWFDDEDDVAIEFAGEGTNDTVYSRVDTTLGASLEILRLVGGALDGYGNGLGNGIFGTESQNLLRGGDGNDALTGNGGNDFLHGEVGVDRLYGGMGADVMSGGSEADFFQFRDAAETSYVLLGTTIYDRITDFSSAQGDKIDVSWIDANGAAAGTPMFTYIDANPFHGVAGELRYADHFVQGDVNGDGFADFMIEVNVASLARTDFLL